MDILADGIFISGGFAFLIVLILLLILLLR
jgi:hypothetical protein